ncbi:GMC oxidoreductase family [Klebsormidium nitens]|uniref:GMC oxidoreductase family n=1 Tax=Klebsormidium nitens TaxID=105231 RepID=A0A1Y1I6H9_KLENI|nr:GMC oxidoreductase family [Klebsormidium nitens]|eukprot:GAQ86564.1 GMC oxidoreductase family [Klebsormidium nitens]
MHGKCRVGEVVDEEHRVKGVGELRVMDASVFRDSPGTNPMATIMAVGWALGLRMRKERGTRTGDVSESGSLWPRGAVWDSAHSSLVPWWAAKRRSGGIGSLNGWK